MYTTFYGMCCNPFLKDESIEHPFESNDFKQCLARLEYLRQIKGIGLFTGSPGSGKTYVVRSFIKTLNRDLYKAIYISATKEMTKFDFFKILANHFSLDVGACYSTDIYQNIQKEIKRMVTRDYIQPIIIIDDAHLLSKDILMSFKVLYDFEMDSKDYVSLVLIGHNELREEISKTIHEALKQRIIVNYIFNGLSREEVKKYISTRFEVANVNQDVFNQDAMNALYSCSKSSPRRLNTLVIVSLMLGYQNGLTEIDSTIIMEAQKEIDLN